MLTDVILLAVSNFVAFAAIIFVLFAASAPIKLRLLFVATVVCLVLWQDTVYISNSVANNLLFWNNFVFVWPTLAVLSFYYFVQSLTDTSEKRFSKISGAGTHTQLYKIISYVLFAGVIAQMVSVLSGSIFIEEAHEITRGSLYVVYIAGLAVAIIALSATIWLSFKNVRNDLSRKKALKTVVITVIAAAVYGLILNVIIPLVTNSQSFAIYGALVIIIFSFGLLFSIIKDRLLDVKLYVVRTVAYILSLATLALIYGIIAYILSTYILRQNMTSAQGFTNIALSLLLAFLFQPIKSFFDRLTNKIFYRNRYSREIFFAALNETLSKSSDLGKLTINASKIIASTLGIERVYFVTTQKGSIYSGGTAGYIRIAKDDLEAITTYATERGGEMILLREVSSDTAALTRILKTYGTTLVMPLKTDKGILGFIFLGKKRSGEYVRRDISVLDTVRHEIALAIQNALSVQELKELNETLQLRIDNATKDLRSSNDQLKKLDQTKDEFISMASHQLRTPLTSIKGYIDMMLDGDAGAITPTQKKFLTEAYVSSEKMVRLINDFLNVSRLQTGKFIIEKTPVDLAKVVRQEIDALKLSAEGRDLSFKLSIQKNIPKLMLDEAKIRQVIMNFADNALYYSKPATEVKVTLKLSDNNVLLTIKDTGIGVPEEEQGQLFTKFFRAANARKQRPDGTGVGLFLAKKVISAHGGALIFLSKLNKGSTFGFSLPIDHLRVRDDSDKLN